MQKQSKQVCKEKQGRKTGSATYPLSKQSSTAAEIRADGFRMVAEHDCFVLVCIFSVFKTLSLSEIKTYKINISSSHMNKVVDEELGTLQVIFKHTPKRQDGGNADRWPVL